MALIVYHAMISGGNLRRHHLRLFSVHLRNDIANAKLRDSAPDDNQPSISVFPGRDTLVVGCSGGGDIVGEGIRICEPLQSTHEITENA